MKKTNTIWQRIACGGLVLTLASGVGLPISAVAATTGGSGCCNMNGAKGHKEFKAMHEKLLSQAKAEDAALEKMVADLNKAPEAKKVDLEAAILTKLVAQHHQMLTTWESMHARRMQAKNQHIQRQTNQAEASGGASAPQ